MSGVLAIGHARAGDLPGGHQVLAGARTRMPSTGLRTLDATAARLSFYAGRRDSAIAQARRALSEEGLDPAEQTTRLQLLTLLQAGDSSEVAIVGEGTFKLLRDPSRFDPLQSLGALAAVPQTSGRPLALLYLADAAATEGRFLGYPSLAVSLVGADPIHFKTAGAIVSRLLKTLIEEPLPGDTILNVNIPDVPIDEIQGYQATRLGHRQKAEPAIKGQDPRGKEIYWIGSVGPEEAAGPGTDFHALRENFVSVTPLKIDLTQYANLDSLSDWVSLIGS